MKPQGRRTCRTPPSRLAPAAPSERGRLFIKGRKAHPCPTQPQRTDVRQAATLHAPRINPWAQPPKSAPAAKAAAATPGRINAPTRDEGHAPGPNSGGAADPNAHRRHSRRSSTQLGKRTRAKLKAAASASGRIIPPTRVPGPKNPHPAAASRASGSNCGWRGELNYQAQQYRKIKEFIQSPKW